MSDEQRLVSEELRMQARQQHISGNAVEAIQLLTQAIQQDPSNTSVAMDMVQVFIDIGETAQAASLYGRLPDADKQSDIGRTLAGQLTFIELASKTDG
ncbi:MAG: tetratricopeptide repeat protein, partial [Gammaproteobacteria bacterium]|nr:tetratricopeptide repeat protein [Gammaproteobacteria bacterium]